MLSVKDILPIHTAVKGRTRFKINSLYRNQETATELEHELLIRNNDIYSARANTKTATLLVEHKADMSLDHLAEGIQDVFNGKVHNKNSEPKNKQNNPKNKIVPDHPAEWHRLDAREVTSRVNSSAEHGLSILEAKSRLGTYGANKVEGQKPVSQWRIFLRQLTNLPISLLIGSSLISAATGGLTDAAVILGVVLINASIGFVTESKAARTIQLLTASSSRRAQVIRDGQEIDIDAEMVVPGDILVLKPGTPIVADGRLLKAENLTINESILTGESEPVFKDIRTINGRRLALGDRTNMVYRETFVTGGNGLALVVNTGRRTEIGRIQQLVETAKVPETPIEKQLNKLGLYTVIVSGSVCSTVFAIGLLRGETVINMLKTAISLAVAAVPEGLPTVATTTLTLGFRRLRKVNVVVRRLDSVETLGAVQIICLDKTGTLTCNQMNVASVIAGGRPFKATLGQLHERGEPVLFSTTAPLKRLLQIATLCNEVVLRNEADGLHFDGSPTEACLIKMAHAAELDVVGLRRTHPAIKMRHRTERRPYMISWHKTKRDHILIAAKGSPIHILELCSHYEDEEGCHPLTPKLRRAIDKRNEELASQGQRVLGLAYRKTSQDKMQYRGELTWIGLVSIADTVREGMNALMKGFHSAGIKTVMITGDQKATAAAIGKKINIGNGGSLKTFDAELLQNSKDALQLGADDGRIFARVNPSHKLKIIEDFQKAGKVVAMTGDGINDGPALKAADIGIAMGGANGSKAATELADVILADDNLLSLIRGIKQGRTIRDDIHKSLRFLLSTNASELCVMLGAVSLGIGQPLTPMQLLWINLITDVFPVLALGLEPPEEDVMLRPPPEPHASIISKRDLGEITTDSIIMTLGALASYLYGIRCYGQGAQARTMAFASLTAAQLMYAISSRSAKHTIFHKRPLPRNAYFSAAMVAGCGLQLLAFLVPNLRSILSITPLARRDLLAIAFPVTLSHLLVETLKWIRVHRTGLQRGSAASQESEIEFSKIWYREERAS